MSEATVKASAARDAGAPTGNRWLVLAIVLAAVFMQLLDTTITTVAVPSIQSSLDTTFGEVQLVLAGYSLAFACVLITGGRLGDIYGRKRLFLIGMITFTAASALCGAAPNGLTLVIARIAQGMCSGLMFPQVLAILQVTFPAREKPKAFAIYGATIGLATILGPVLGGSLIKLDLFGADWRAIFYVNVPIGLAALAAGLRQVGESRAADADRLDLAGVVLATTGLFLLVLPLVVGRDQGWPVWSLLMLIGSAPVLVAFAAYEWALTRRPGSSPLMRTTLFGQRSFSVGLVLCLVFFAGIPSFFFTFLLTLQVGFGYQAVSAGAVTLAFAIMVAAGSARSAAVTRRLGTWTLLLGCALLSVGMAGVFGLLRWAGTDLHGYQLIPALIVAGAGAGLVLAPLTSVILAGIKHTDAGAASGVLATAQQVGAAAGIAIVGLILFGQLGGNANSSAALAVPALHARLAAAGLPAPAADQVVAGFRTCFHDRANQNDPTAIPASCRRIEQQVAAAPAPPAIKARVASAVTGQAVPLARKDDFTRSLQHTLLLWQIPAFLFSGLLVFALPKVRPATTIPGGA
ncbi:MAG TPA: MFS transporter [Streptosporangiaceae bacterium]